MDWHLSWQLNSFHSLQPLSIWVYFLIYSRGADRSSFSKLLIGCSLARHLLCSCTLSLCIKDGRSICAHGGICKLVPFNDRHSYKPRVTKSAILNYICRGKPDFFSYALSRISWHTSSLFRLSRFLLHMKCFSQGWVYNFNGLCVIYNFYLMRIDSQSPTCPFWEIFQQVFRDSSLLSSNSPQL